MSVTDLTVVQAQMQERWSPLFTDELRQNNVLISLVDRKEFTGVVAEGNSVKVSQIVKPNGEMLDINTKTFNSEEMRLVDVDVKIEKRAVGAFEIYDLAKLMSQLNSHDSDIRQALVDSCQDNINTYLYSKLNPQTSHKVASVATFDKTQMAKGRTLAAKARWGKAKNWYGLLSPDYYGDVIDALPSADNVDDKPQQSGLIGTKRYGFQLFEDDTQTTKHGLLFRPDFMHAVLGEPVFEISSLHSQKKFGFLLSVYVLAGATLGIEGDKKHMTFKA